MECLEHVDTLYVNGKTNTGKTSKVLQYVKENDYEYKYTPLQNIKNEEAFHQLMHHNNIFNMMKNKKNKPVIIIDNIDYLQNSDKSLLGNICKYVKKKKKNEKNRKNRKNIKNTKNTKNNESIIQTSNIHHPKIVFIGANTDDKKVIDLLSQVDNVITFNEQFSFVDENKSVKESVHQLLVNPDFDACQICEKTIVSLVYHENIIKCINDDYHFYEKVLKSFTIGDYYDRISFQRQLWQFNDMTFYLKVVENNYRYHKKNFSYSVSDLETIFTKILTKYSNEYSNLNFVISCCNTLNCQKSELLNIIMSNEDIAQLTNIEYKRLQRIFI